eukprot:12932672-Prorocentrum_lima.AAC.1
MPMGMTVAPHHLGVERFIVDTGCGCSLIQQGLVFRVGSRNTSMPLDNHTTLYTAVGITNCTDNVCLSVPLLDEGSCDAL